MRIGLVVAILIVLPAVAYPDGILKRFGADGPISRRFSEQEPQEVIIFNGQRYRVQRQQGNGGAFDPDTGDIHPRVPGGAINSRTGEFYPAVRGGVIDPSTGNYFPYVNKR